MKIESDKPPICLTIAGLDPSGGAGIIADIKTFTVFKCFATSVITSLTFQNTTGVFGAVNQSTGSVKGQLQPILDDFQISALKSGMLPDQNVIEVVADFVQRNNLSNFVVDPVIRSTSGFDLIDNKALKSLIEKLFPLADLVTPNIPEAERITGIEIKTEADFEKAAGIIQRLGVRNVLIKGGHFEENKSQKKVGKITAKDYLFIGNELNIFEGEFYQTRATHGTGCTLAAAITANLALGKTLIEAVGIAKKFVNEAIKTAPNIGHGNSPINHFAQIEN